MTEMSSLRPTTRLSAIVLLAIVLNGSAASAQVPLGSAQNFAVLAGTVVTCTDSTVTGDVGVWPGSTVAQTGCTVAGTVHAADSVAQNAYLQFISAYNNLRDHPPACRATATATLAEALLPGVYCVDSTAKTGPLILDARGDAKAVWLFLVDGALTGTNFTVTMINGGQPCNVAWWVKAAATLTDSKFLGTILAGAAITVTRGTLVGHAWATAAATLTGAPTLRLALSACRSSAGDFPPVGDKCEERHDKDGDDDDKDGDHHDKGGNVHGKCNQGVGNGPEGCDPGNSNHHNRSNDERGGTPGNPGRKNQARKVRD